MGINKPKFPPTPRPKSPMKGDHLREKENAREKVRKSRTLANSQDAYFIGFFGNSRLAEIYARDFLPILESSLKKSGFTEDSGAFTLQQSRKKPSFRAHANQSLEYTISIFLLLQSASWGLKTVFDEIYKPHIRTALASFLKKLRSKDSLNLNPNFDSSFWLEPLQIMITIRISGSSAHGLIQSETHSAEAYNFAHDWLATKGATHKYITVVVHDGVLSPIPILSNEAPSRRQVTHIP